VGHEEPCLAAIYAFGLRPSGGCELAALYSEAPAWANRLDLELAVAKALDLEGAELIDLRRMPLVFRFGVVNQGEPIFVGQPDVLAQFIEETIARYSAFYPLLEALYWETESRPVPEDGLDSSHQAMSDDC
jgi:hypothetical protein